MSHSRHRLGCGPPLSPAVTGTRLPPPDTAPPDAAPGWPATPTSQPIGHPSFRGLHTSP